jgi:hypothetical protein
VAEEPKHKTPAELGEAVGRKIEELFGDLLGGDSIETPGPSIAAAPVTSSVQDNSKPAQPSADLRGHDKVAQPATPSKQTAPTNTVLKPSNTANRPSGVSASGHPQGGKVSFDQIVERIEVLILSVEWEVSTEAGSELIEQFRILSQYYPSNDRARTILAMNSRVLRRFSGSEVSPHPLFVKLLEDSLAVLKSMHVSPGDKNTEKALVTLNDIYKKIMASPLPEPEVDKGKAETGQRSSAVEYDAILKKVGTTIQSLEEVTRRLSRIGGALAQGSDISGSETARRLGTLENLVSQQVGQLSSLHQELTQVGPADELQPKSGGLPANSAPDGLLTVLWAGIPLAISSSIVAALYPLTKVQAEQFKEKQSITLGSRVLQKLPLRKPPETKEQPAVLPAWLVHINWRQKDSFLLVDRSLGFRRIPDGTNIAVQTRIKFGPVSYSVLSESTLR